MTTTADHTARQVPLEQPPIPGWHRPLLLVAIAMVVLAVATALLSVVQPIEISGENGWYKPLKFAISIAVYSVSLAWLIGHLRRWHRAAHVAGSITAAALVTEMVIIVGAAAFGTTSHFNVTTVLHTVLYAVMAVSTVVIWVMALLVGVAIVRDPGPDRARNLTVRGAVAIGVIGMALGALMTMPTEQQLADYEGIIGSHVVGVAGDGPGLPILGWSTVGGDLRIPHFVGMHGLQALPLALLAIELLATRVPLLLDGLLRLRLMRIAIVAYAAATAVVLWQSLIGQSIVAPVGAVLLAGVALVAGTALAVAACLWFAHRDHSRAVPHLAEPAAQGATATQNRPVSRREHRGLTARGPGN